MTAPPLPGAGRPALCRVDALRITDAARRQTRRTLPEEVPVALVYDGTTYAVMMASPADLEDFALGFSLSEGIITDPAEISDIEIASSAAGIEARLWLMSEARNRTRDRRRALLGPTGCGLCGIDSLEQALPPLPVVSAGRVLSARVIHAAMASLRPAQQLNAEAHALHAAAFWTPEEGIRAVREDVGRHNALDKLVGALVRTPTDPATGLLLLTSRVSVEMVQKAARLGAPILAAVSAPTALALRTAEAAGITVIAIARDDLFEVFTRPDRLGAPELGVSLRAAV